GKSTLFNRLCGTEGALVSPTRGTTRDWLAASLNWNGLPVELIDTAGQEQEIDSLTGQMQQQRHGQLEQADLVLWCSPASAEASQQQEDAGLLAGLAGLSVPWLQVRTMSDLARSIDPAAPPAAVEGNLTSETAGADAPDEHGPIPAGSVSVSAVTGAGLSQLVNLACARLHGTPGTGDNRLRQMLGSTQSRCRASLQEAMTALDEARTAAAAGAGDELVAMELRAALEELGQVAGSVCTNDLLDRIFSRFCIGK
ncbi:MAG: 50S ribosome-binding GTPase, partial [Planctomycetales bacterium]|nr:50S ribosome-binding GTPase [Planctomycetales bacterium]